MKSLLQTLRRTKEVRLFGAAVKTNLQAVVGFSEKNGTSDPLLISAIQNAFADVEIHDLMVIKGSVMLVRGKISIWMSPGPGVGVVVNKVRTRRSIPVTTCRYCKRKVYADPDKEISLAMQARLHRPTCLTILAFEIMET